ncbi:amidase signature domain-containing protein [Infundibulicybe gibba]|nr:amidase signature domain-containing protein [Infundibulicybe gibba]
MWPPRINWGTILVASIFSSFATASVQISSTDKDGMIFRLDDAPYYALKEPSNTLNSTRRLTIPSGFSLLTSIRTQYSPITKKFLEAQIALFGQLDDVWNERFMESLFISYDGPAGAYFDDAAEEWLRNNGISNLYLSKNVREPVLKKQRVFQLADGPLTGPYLIASTSKLSQTFFTYSVYRLMKDEYEAFLFGAIPNHKAGKWTATNITLDGDGIQYIPVPSRLSAFAAKLPLAGPSDGAGSLAYAQVHPIPSVTAYSVRKLIANGAALVGKTRTSQFAHGAQPWDFRDIPYSWNPRADGYLTASASSSGSACAIAGYPWLEFTVGSDTRGSVRKPAAMVGAYGIRPTRGSIDMSGIVPLSEEMDTAGFFARDPRMFREITHHWYANSPVISKRPPLRFPTKILYPVDHFPVANPAAQTLYDSFVEALELYMNMTKVSMNLTDTLLPQLPNQSFSEFQLASNKLADYQSWESVGKPLSEMYEKMTGWEPTFDPIPQKMFARARDLTEGDFADAVDFKRKFTAFISNEFLKADRKSCSESLFMYDIGSGGKPSYRVEEFNSLDGATSFPVPSTTEGTKPTDMFSFLASMADLPEVTIPIGQVGYYSQISRRWESLPVAVQLVAHPGCDFMLVDLVQKLAELGVLGPTVAGRTAF